MASEHEGKPDRDREADRTFRIPEPTHARPVHPLRPAGHQGGDGPSAITHDRHRLIG